MYIKVNTINTLEICNLTSIINNKLILNNINISLFSGDSLFLEGVNGSGKSTLIRHIAGLLEPIQGDILWNMNSIYNYDSVYMNSCIDSFGIWSYCKKHLTVLDNIIFWVKLYHSNDNPIDLLYKVKLDHLKDIQVSYLSTGQQKRLSMCRLFMSCSPLWLLDEPHLALDKDGVILVYECIKAHLLKGGIIILASHSSILKSFFPKPFHSLVLD